MPTPKIQIALADDHPIFLDALKKMLNEFDDYQVMYTAHNGEEVVRKIKSGTIPDILLLDMRMPVMDGFDTALWIRQHCPRVKVLILTMYDTDVVLVRLLNAGIRGVVKKNAEPSELVLAINTVMKQGHYFGNDTAGRMARLLLKGKRDHFRIQGVQFSDEEITFLKLASSELTYKQIADKLCITPRVIDAMRDQLFKKLHISSRVGLAVYAIKHGLVGF